MLIAAGGLCLVTLWAVPLFLAVAGYFFGLAHHPKAVRIAKRTGKWTAYPLCLGVMCVTMFSNLAGYLVGSWQRWRNQGRYRHRMEAYLASS